MVRLLWLCKSMHNAYTGGLRHLPKFPRTTPSLAVHDVDDIESFAASHTMRLDCKHLRMLDDRFETMMILIFSEAASLVNCMV